LKQVSAPTVRWQGAALGLVFAGLVLGGCSGTSTNKGTGDPMLPATARGSSSMTVTQAAMAATPAGATVAQARRTHPRSAPYGVGRAEPTVTAVDLPTVLRLATGRNLDVQVVREKLREAHADMVHAGWWALPTIRPNVRFSHVRGNEQNNPGVILDVNKDKAYAGAGVFVDWEIGEALFDQLAAQQRACASKHAVDASMNDAGLEAAVSYFVLLRQQTALAVADESRSLYEKLVAETEAQVAAGGGFRGDALRAKAKLAHATVMQKRAQIGQQRAALRLREILNMPSTVQLFASEGQPVMLSMIDPHQSEDELLRMALVGRPELREARGNAKAMLAERNKTTVGPWIPRVTAGFQGGGLGTGFGSLGDRTATGVGVEWRIGRDGIGGKARQASAAARERQSRLQIQQVSQRIVRQVADARSAALSQEEAVEAAESGARDAKEALELFRQRMQIGVGIPLDAISAEETYTESRLDYLDAVIGYNTAQMRLLRAIGQMR
jgi:outer membrane protein TolC